MEPFSFDGIFQATQIAIYAQAFLFAAIVWIVAALIRTFMVRQFTNLAAKTNTKFDDALIPVVESIKPFAFSAIAFAAFLLFSAPEGPLNTLGQNAIFVALTYQAVVSLGELVAVVIRTSLTRRDGKDRRAAISFAIGGAKVVLWVFGILVVFSNLGINITSLIAGLGIGGVAVAFALQKILGDLFSSFAIYFDRPFEVGDYIVTGEHSGIVEKVGLKTTRIRALQGEEIVIPNESLTTSRIQNFKKMTERRVPVVIGVLYETPQSKLKEIPGVIQKIVEDEKNARFDRANLKEFADSSINFEFVYYVLSGNYNEYMNTNERVLLAIKEAFEKRGIEFAYPTRTLYVKK